MDITKAQQKALDDALVAPKNRLKIRKCNQRLSHTLKSNEPTIQVALDALKLTPFYNAFEEDLVYQVKNKNSKKNNDMYYPRFTKVIVDYFMEKDQTIPRRNKMFCHYARDDLMFTTIRVISKHQDTQVYDAILPQHLTNQDMLESEAYKTYHTYATGEKTLKQKSTKKKADSESSPKTKPTQASKGKRIKTSAKGVIPAKKKQSATKSKGLTVLSEVALTEAEQMKIALERSKIQTHSSHASGSGADEGNGITPGVPDVPTYESDAEKISWKSSDEEDDDEAGMHDDNDANDDDDNNDNNDDDTKNQDDDDQDDEEQDDVNELTDSDNDGDDFVHLKLSTHDEEDKEEEDSDQRVHTPSNYESTNDEESDEEIQGANVKGEEMDVEETNDADKANELYKDVNVNLEGRDTKMIDSSFVSSGFVSNMLNPSPDTGIDFIFNLNTESTLLIDVPVTTIPSRASLSTTTLPTTHNLSSHILQQTKSNTRKTAPSSSLQDLPNFVVSSIPGIADAYLANKMHEAVKIVDQVKEQVKAQVSKILLKIEKTVNEQLEAEVLTHSSNESKTSYAIAANLSELELKNILIDKMESNKLIHGSDKQKNLYKALNQEEKDKDEEPSAGSNRGSKRRRTGKEPESTSAPKEKTSKTTGKSTEGSKSHQKSADESAQAEEPMQTKPAKPPTPDHDWNKTLLNAHGPVQPWLSSLS
ncbi:hypothetical protein Tco_1087843 [Tanacetum coccineum]